MKRGVKDSRDLFRDMPVLFLNNLFSLPACQHILNLRSIYFYRSFFFVFVYTSLSFSLSFLFPWWAEGGISYVCVPRIHLYYRWILFIFNLWFGICKLAFFFFFFFICFYNFPHSLPLRHLYILSSIENRNIQSHTHNSY